MPPHFRKYILHKGKRGAFQTRSRSPGSHTRLIARALEYNLPGMSGTLNPERGHIRSRSLWQEKPCASGGQSIRVTFRHSRTPIHALDLITSVYIQCPDPAPPLRVTSRHQTSTGGPREVGIAKDDIQETKKKLTICGRRGDTMKAVRSNRDEVNGRNLPSLSLHCHPTTPEVSLCKQLTPANGSLIARRSLLYRK